MKCGTSNDGGCAHAWLHNITVKNKVCIPHKWCVIWHCGNANHPNKSVVGTPQCQILHHIFYSDQQGTIRFGMSLQ